MILYITVLSYPVHGHALVWIALCTLLCSTLYKSALCSTLCSTLYKSALVCAPPPPLRRFVFDGKPPELKSQELARRAERRGEATAAQEAAREVCDE